MNCRRAAAKGDNKGHAVKLRTQSFVVLVLVFGGVYFCFLYGLAVHVQQMQDDDVESNNNSKFVSVEKFSRLMKNTREEYKEKLLEAITAEGDTTGAIKNATQTVLQRQEIKRKKPMLRPGFRANPHGHMVDPQVLLPENSNPSSSTITIVDNTNRIVPEDQMLTAYLEPIDKSTWDIKPLPVRNVQLEDLTVTRYPKLNSCSKLPEQWPVEDYPDDDPFCRGSTTSFPPTMASTSSLSLKTNNGVTPGRLTRKKPFWSNPCRKWPCFNTFL